MINIYEKFKNNRKNNASIFTKFSGVNLNV